MAAGLAVLGLAAYGIGRRARPKPALPAPPGPPPEPPLAAAPRRLRWVRRQIVAGLAIGALAFSGAALSAEPVAPKRSIRRPAIAAPVAWPQALRVLIRSQHHRARHRVRHRVRRRVRVKRHVHRVLSLTELVLRDPRISIYPGGRADIVSGRVDKRILRLLLYLARLDHEVTVSSLISGHRLYARPGVISAHVYGRAVDITALDGVPVAGHQYSGSLTEQAVRALLQLPPRLRPRQVISLFGLGGPSFSLPNHADHIHIGY